MPSYRHDCIGHECPPTGVVNIQKWGRAQVMKEISKDEFKFVIKWSVLILAITCIPYLYGYLSAPSKLSFIGLSVCNSADFNTYLAWARQAKEGELLFKCQYTSEEQKRIFFNPLFLSLGVISRVTSLPLIGVFHIFRIISGFFLLFISYLFISFIISDKYIRRVAFFLILVSSGFGAYLYVLRLVNPQGSLLPIDLWVPEAITFWTIYLSPLFSISSALILTIFLLMLKFFKDGKIKFVLYAGLILLALGSIHPYDLFIVYPPLLFYSLYLSFKNKSFFKGLLLPFLTLFLFSLPIVLYNYWCLQENPIFQDWLSAPRLSPSPLSYILGYGFVFIFALLGGIRVLILKLVPDSDWGAAPDSGRGPVLNSDGGPVLSSGRGKDTQYLPLFWVLSSACLIYLPLSFQRKLIEGVHIPLCILAAEGLFWGAKKLKRLLDYQRLIRIIIILTIFSNLAVIATDLKVFRMHSFPYYLSKCEISAMDYLKDNTSSSSVVLCSYHLGNFLPARSGNRVFLGHYDQTLNSKEKKRILRKFFNQEVGERFREKVLKEYNIGYLYYGKQEKALGGFNPDKCLLLARVYENEEVSIYRTTNKHE